MRIDHVTIGGPSLAQMDTAFAGLGLTTDYGGIHSNGITHMSLLGFEDGSYIELISALESAEKEHPFWQKHIKDNGGPCAWAIYAEDVAAEAARVAEVGIAVDGPHYHNRRRPDGDLVEWNSAFLGDKGAGATLPFIIKDITPRLLRVRPSAGVAGEAGQPALLTGIDTVVLGVEAIETAAELFQRVYGWPAPQIEDDPNFGARLADFGGTPAVLATSSPSGKDIWPAERLAQFGESPCAFLIGTSNFEVACKQFDVLQPVAWFGRHVAWFDPDKLNGVRLGLVG